MELSQAAFALFCAASVVAGAFLGVVYDAFSILPSVCGRVYNQKLHNALTRVKMPFVPHKSDKIKERLLNVALFLHDFLFMIGVGVLMALVIYRFNDGQIRVAAPVGFAVGFFAYRATFRRFVAPISELTGFAVRYIFSLIAFCLSFPVQLVVGLVRRTADAVGIAKMRRYIKKFTEREKEDIKMVAELYGCLELKIKNIDRKDVTKNGKKKIKYNNSMGDRGNARSFGSRKRDKHNAV